MEESTERTTRIVTALRAVCEGRAAPMHPKYGWGGFLDALEKRNVFEGDQSRTHPHIQTEK